MGLRQLRLTATLVSAVLLGSLTGWDATASSLYSVSTVGNTYTGPGFSSTADSGPTSASTADSYANATGSWSATSRASALSGSGGRVKVTGCLINQFQGICNGANTTADTQDTIRILATGLAPVGTVVAVRFDWLVDGTVSGFGAWSVDTALNLGGPPGALGAATYASTTGGVDVVASGPPISEVRSFTANLLVGTNYSLTSRFNVGGAMRLISDPHPFDIDVDLAGGIQATITTPDLGPLQLLGDSGRDYLLPPVPYVDTDGDGVPDATDNCTQVANPTQVDSDHDGYGNRCDGDLSNNGSTNAQDTTLYRQQLGQPSVAPTYNAADINANGSVNAQDTTLFRQLVGAPPGPSGLACAGTIPCP